MLAVSIAGWCFTISWVQFPVSVADPLCSEIILEFSLVDLVKSTTLQCSSAICSHKPVFIHRNQFKKFKFYFHFPGIKFYKPPPDEVANPTNVMSNEEVVDRLYARHGSIASIILEEPDLQRMQRMTTIGEEEEEETASEGETGNKIQRG